MRFFVTFLQVFATLLVLLSNCHAFSVKYNPNSIKSIKFRQSNPLFTISYKNQLTKLINKEDLTTSEVEEAWDAILQSNMEPAVIGSLLSLLRAKGESPKEITGMVKSMQKACIPVNVSVRLSNNKFKLYNVHHSFRESYWI